jgi:hypothetical protein
VRRRRGVAWICAAKRDALLRAIGEVVAQGDVMAWGSPARLCHHGVLPLKPNHHQAFGDYRINLALRRAG